MASGRDSDYWRCYWHVQPAGSKIRSVIQHFAAGVVFSVVTVELLPDVVRERRPVQGCVAKISLRRGMSSSARRSCGKLKQRRDELRLSHRITSTQSFDLTFAYHVQGFDAFEGSFRSVEPLEAS